MNTKTRDDLLLYLASFVLVHAKQSPHMDEAAHALAAVIKKANDKDEMDAAEKEVVMLRKVIDEAISTLQRLEWNQEGVVQVFVSNVLEKLEKVANHEPDGSTEES